MEVLGAPQAPPAGRSAMRYRRGTTAALAAVATAFALGVAVPQSAQADPATPGTYPAASSASRTSGRFFDTCSAPSLAALAAWRSSPYTGVNIYFGGRNRGC